MLIFCFVSRVFIVFVLFFFDVLLGGHNFLFFLVQKKQDIILA